MANLRRKYVRILSMTEKERRAYFEHLDNIMVQNDVLDTAHDEGFEDGFDLGMEKGIEAGMKEGLEKGMKEGLEKGIEKGIEKGVENVARKMIEQELPDEMISSLTGLSLEVLAALRRKID